jgi:hypothetical protein
MADNKIYTFSVAGNPPVFTYAAPEMWPYSGTDTVRFQTKSGKFTLDMNRADALPKPNEKKPFGPLKSSDKPDANGFFFVETKITDGLTKKQRDDARAQNQTGADSFGFIAKYKYQIAVTLIKDGKETGHLSDAQHNGEYKC